MNGIDVSNWQHGIGVANVPCDFVIAKATQGQNYVSPDCDRVIQQCISLGKPWGVYHYIDGSGVAEIDFFINNCKGYIGNGILCLDWERVQNGAVPTIAVRGLRNTPIWSVIRGMMIPLGMRGLTAVPFANTAQQRF